MKNSNKIAKWINRKIDKSQQGFTLLEILVVISIIGILLAIGSVAFSTAQKKGRDAKRRGDVKAMQNGFEQYYANNSSSYDTCALMMADSEIFPGGVPIDPKTGDDYICTNPAGGYCVCALLDDSTAGNDDGGDCGFSGTGYFCLSNLQ